MRELHEIAAEITDDWTAPYFGAVPYLKAMRCLRTPADFYGLDHAEDIVIRFLANATTWRGDTARRVKRELKALFGLK